MSKIWKTLLQIKTFEFFVVFSLFFCNYTILYGGLEASEASG